MTCHEIRESLSARLDNEPAVLDDDQVAAHLASCAACRAYAEQTVALHRSTRVRAATPVPDLTPQIMAAISDESAPDRRTGLLRLVLAVAGLVQLAIAAPALVGVDHGMAAHDARHLGSFTAALAVGFLFAAWRPTRVSGLLPVVAVLVALVVGTSIIDVASGRAAAGSEAGHVTEIIGLAAAWLLTRPAIRPNLAPA